LKSEIDNFNNVLTNDITTKANLSSIDLGGVYRLSKSTDNSYFRLIGLIIMVQLMLMLGYHRLNLILTMGLILLNFMLIH
jgi:hypothetical protein